MHQGQHAGGYGSAHVSYGSALPSAPSGSASLLALHLGLDSRLRKKASQQLRDQTNHLKSLLGLGL